MLCRYQAASAPKYSAANFSLASAGPLSGTSAGEGFCAWSAALARPTQNTHWKTAAAHNLPMVLKPIFPKRLTAGLFSSESLSILAGHIPPLRLEQPQSQDEGNQDTPDAKAN